MTAQQPKVQQFESTGFQDSQQQRHLVTNTTVSVVKLKEGRRGKGGIGGKKRTFKKHILSFLAVNFY
jgi:hypothetical protein